MGIDGAADAEIGVGVDRQAVRLAEACESRRPPSAPAKASSLIPSGSGITAASIIAGGPPTKTFTRNGLPASNRRRVVHADRAMDLIVQADFAVRLVLAAGKLHAVHAEVRAPPARRADIFGVDLRQRDERAAVVRPAHLLRQLRDRRFVPVTSARRTNFGSMEQLAPRIALARCSGRRNAGVGSIFSSTSRRTLRGRRGT